MQASRRLTVVLALLAGCGPLDAPEEPTRDTVSAQGEALRPCGDRSYLLRDIYRGIPGSEPMELTRGDRLLFFTADDGMSGRELWKSDGTRDGTRRVKDIFPGATSSAPNDLLEFKGRIYFAANDGTHGDELWRT